MEKNSFTLMDAIKYTLGFTKGFKLQFVLFYLSGFINTIAAILSPILFGEMINQIVYYKNINTFYNIGGVFFVLTIFTCVNHFLMYYIYSYLWNMFNFRVRRTVFKKIQIIDAEEMTNQNYGDLVNMVHIQAQETMQLLVRNIIHPINNVLLILVSVFFMFRINVILALTMLVLVSIATYVTYFMGGKIRYFKDQYWIKYASYSGWIFEMLNALVDIRLLGVEKKIERVYYEQQDDMNEVDIKAGISRLTSENILSSFNLLFKLLLYILLALLSIYNNANIGIVIIVLTYFTVLSNNLSSIAGSYNDAQTRIKVIERIKDFIESVSEEKWSGEEELVINNGTVEIKNVSFRYKNKEKIIEDISLVVSQGEKIALVGESGCGKSTLASMLLGYYRPSEGEILVEGNNLQNYTIQSIRRSIGLIQQNVLLFDGTIRENIIIGNPKASESEIIDACKNAGIYEFIDSLEKGFNTVVGVNGRQLSGGQKQRIAIARIYLKNPKIIIYDEATSALDAETEKLIHESWNKVLSDRSALVIAHRLSAVMLCDKVAIMREGRIVEIGRPDEMIKSSDEFRALFALSS